MFKKMSMRAVLAPAAALCVLISGCAHAADGQRLAPAGAGFSIMMPGTPKADDQQVPTAAGQITMHSYSMDMNGAGYVVMYADYPMAMDPKTGLAGVRNGEVGTGKLVSEKDFTVSGSPAKKIVVTTADGHTMVSEMVLVGKRLYQVIYVTNDAKNAENASNGFMTSFQLVK